MNFYKILKYFSIIQSPRIKMAGLWTLHLLNRRTLGVYIDPILGCNYHCQMCYFSNDAVRRSKRGKMTDAQINALAQSVFPNAMKLQIGCGAEPTLDMPHTLQLITLGHRYHVPYISLTTNGILLDEAHLRDMLQNGLNEITLSLHGIHKETYTKMMGITSNYERFAALLQLLKKMKETFPDLHIRINYTMNADNVDELQDWDTLFHDIPITEVQLRPIREIGDSAYKNFDLHHVAEVLPTIVHPLTQRLHRQGICVIAPQQIHIDMFAHRKQQSARLQMMSLFTYLNVTPENYNQSPVDFERETYPQYKRRTHIGRTLFKHIFSSEEQCAQMGKQLSTAINYDIQ